MRASSFLGVNLNAGEDVADADVAVDETITLELNGGDGDDALSVSVQQLRARELIGAGGEYFDLRTLQPSRRLRCRSRPRHRRLLVDLRVAAPLG